MGNIINKSNHPVEVKRIDVHVWKLRDEIEAAIATRVHETENISDVEIEDIKEFYSNLGSHIQADDGLDDLDDLDDDEDDSNLDASGNPLDDDAMAMMAAMGGGEEEAEKNDDSEAEAAESTDEENEPEEASEEDDEAAKLAAEMLGDQVSDSAEDDEAAKLAAQMLADQGLGAEEEDDEAAMLAAQMLADQGIGEEAQEEPEAEAFKRVKPKAEMRTHGFSFLSDVNMDQILIFTRDGFTLGQNIIIEFRIPNLFKISAEVIQAKHFARNSNIISETKPAYRILCKINYLFENERSALRSFLESIEPEIPPSPKQIKKPEEDEAEDDDDFDDLGL